MKKVVFMIAMLLFAAGGAGAQVQSATLVASGLTCSMCSKAIFKAIEKVPYVAAVDVDIEKSSYGIKFKSGMEIELDELKKAVQDAGFFVASLEVSVLLEQVAVRNDAHITISGATYHFVKVAEQTLSGPATIKVIDKDYLPVKERKKYGKYTSMKCYETGVAQPCCDHKGKTNRIYHVTI